MIAYKACLTLIKAGKTNGLVDKINLFMAFEQITVEQYSELMEMLVPESEYVAE